MTNGYWSRFKLERSKMASRHHLIGLQASMSINHFRSAHLLCKWCQSIASTIPTCIKIWSRLYLFADTFAIYSSRFILHSWLNCSTIYCCLLLLCFKYKMPNNWYVRILYFYERIDENYDKYSCVRLFLCVIQSKAKKNVAHDSQ